MGDEQAEGGCHLVHTVVLIALAATGGGATWGLGKAWARLPCVSRSAGSSDSPYRPPWPPAAWTFTAAV